MHEFEHLKDVLGTGDLALLPMCESVAAEAVLNRLPWLGAGLDWTALGGIYVPLSREEIDPQGFAKTNIGRHSGLAMYINADTPMIAGAFSHVIARIDEVFWKAPGVRFVFGADKFGAAWRVAYDDFFQYDGTDTLIVRATTWT